MKIAKAFFIHDFLYYGNIIFTVWLKHDCSLSICCKSSVYVYRSKLKYNLKDRGWYLYSFVVTIRDRFYTDDFNHSQWFLLIITQSSCSYIWSIIFLPSSMLTDAVHTVSQDSNQMWGICALCLVMCSTPCPRAKATASQGLTAIYKVYAQKLTQSLWQFFNLTDITLNLIPKEISLELEWGKERMHVNLQLRTLKIKDLTD